jgi:hypothetical protein
MPDSGNHPRRHRQFPLRLIRERVTAEVFELEAVRFTVFASPFPMLKPSSSAKRLDNLSEQMTRQ